MARRAVFLALALMAGAAHAARIPAAAVPKAALKAGPKVSEDPRFSYFLATNLVDPDHEMLRQKLGSAHESAQQCAELCAGSLGAKCKAWSFCWVRGTCTLLSQYPASVVADAQGKPTYNNKCVSALLNGVRADDLADPAPAAKATSTARGDAHEQELREQAKLQEQQRQKQEQERKEQEQKEQEQKEREQKEQEQKEQEQKEQEQKEQAQQAQAPQQPEQPQAPQAPEAPADGSEAQLLALLRRQQELRDALAAQQAAQQAARGRDAPAANDFITLKFINKCTTPIIAAAHYKNFDGQWVTTPWVALGPDQTKEVARTRNTVFYSYANEKGDPDCERGCWDGEDDIETLDNKQFGFREQSMPAAIDLGDQYTHVFDCQGRR